MWSGAVTSIPAGWALCNGQTSNGRTTPNLSGRFIVGAGQGTGLSNRNVGDTGGTENHTLTVGQLPAHNHNVQGTTTSNGDHTHGYNDIFYSESGGTVDVTSKKGSGDSDSDNKGWEIGRTTGWAGQHNHTFNVTSGSTGSGEAFSKLPPFYALAFIMRVQ
jgi:microcystin-dependent protein